MNNSLLTTAEMVYLVGIKGVAMASLAQCLADMGKTVRGSDVVEDFVTKELLQQRGFPVSSGFDPSHITSDIDVVVYTGAHQGINNPEVQAAVSLGIPVMTHAQALGELMDTKKGISVCGTGGKSTTSAMIAWVLERAYLHPSYAVGVGNIPNLGKTGAYKKEGEWFVAEADEYAVDPTSDHRPRFIYQHPQFIVCTNLLYDHPDIYPTFEAIQETFQNFFTSSTAQVVINGDDLTLVKIAGDRSIRVGFEKENIYYIEAPKMTAKQTSATIHFPEGSVEIALSVPGEHNIRNAAYAFAVCNSLRIPQNVIVDALRTFQGTMRRFEYKGSFNEVPCFDDYAHTPDEIVATLTALRGWEPDKRVVLAFQPHTFSRTRALFHEFVEALSQADEIMLLDIFASAREAVDPDITSDLLVQEIHSIAPDKKVMNAHTLKQLATKIGTKLQSGDVFITMGAGDIYQVYEKIDLHI